MGRAPPGRSARTRRAHSHGPDSAKFAPRDPTCLGCKPEVVAFEQAPEDKATPVGRVAQKIGEAGVASPELSGEDEILCPVGFDELAEAAGTGAREMPTTTVGLTVEEVNGLSRIFKEDA